MKTDDKIDRYLTGKMEKEEQQSFEELMRQDDSLETEVDATSHIITAIEKKETQKALESIKRISSEEYLWEILRKAEQSHTSKPIKRKRQLSWRIYGYAAIAIVAILFYGLFPQYSLHSLYAKYDVPEDYEILHSRNSINLPYEQQRNYQNACLSYQAGDYTKAAIQFEKIFSELTIENIPSEGRFYYAIALLKSGQTDKAIQELHIVVIHSEEFHDDAIWQLALGYILKGDRKTAKTTLIPLADRQGYYREKATDLLHDLNQKKWF